MVAHEYAHAEAAYRQGDDTAYMLGRLTLNPLKHIDPIMTVLLPVVLWLSHAGFLFGAAKPVPVNPRKYRQLVRGDVIVSLNAEEVPSRKELYLSLWRHGPGEKLTLEVMRDNRLRRLEITTGDRAEFFKQV